MKTVISIVVLMALVGCGHGWGTKQRADKAPSGRNLEAKDESSRDLDRLRASWMQIYGSLPAELERALNIRFDFVADLKPGERGYQLAMAALSDLVDHSTARAEVQDTLDAAWKKSGNIDAVAFLHVEESGEISSFDWNNATLEWSKDKYGSTFAHFQTCIAGAADASAGAICLKAMKQEAINS